MTRGSKTFHDVLGSTRDADALAGLDEPHRVEHPDGLAHDRPRDTP